MADDQSEEQGGEEAEKKGGTSIVLILLVALVCLGAGAGGGWFLFSGGEAAEAAAEPEVDPAVEAQNQLEAFRERVFALEPFVVNVDGDGYPRYLKLKVEVVCDSTPAREELEARLAQVRDTIILMLSSKRLADINDFEGKALLKDDLRERINEILDQGEIKSVLFTEFVVQ